MGWARASLVFLWSLAGCTAQMVEQRPPRQGPIPEVGLIERGRGEARYSTEGWGWVIALRRRTALAKIRRFCKGMKFEIVEEFTRDDVEVPYTQGELDANLGKGLRHYRVDSFHHVVFECAPR